MSPPPNPALTLRAVDVRYGAVPAVRSVSLEVRSGEVHVLLGHSGSGKTTLLRAIAGFERLASGTLALDGDTVDGSGRYVPPEKRRIGLVFQDYALFPHLSVAQNVAFGMPARDTGAVEQLLGVIGLAHRAAARPSELSGGEQQRVALARALASKPRLLLLDEPFSNLDPDLRGALRDETMRIVRQSGVAAVLVTHSAEEAMAVADRISVLDRGQLVETASPRELYLAPRTLVGARAVGPVSVVAATTLGDGRVRCALGEVRAVNAPADAGARGQLVIRPSVVAVSRAESAAASEGTARVEGCRYGGDCYHLVLRLADGTPLEARCPASEASLDWSGEVRVAVADGGPIWIPDETP